MGLGRTWSTWLGKYLWSNSPKSSESWWWISKQRHAVGSFLWEWIHICHKQTLPSFPDLMIVWMFILHNSLCTLLFQYPKHLPWLIMERKFSTTWHQKEMKKLQIRKHGKHRRSLAIQKEQVERHVSAKASSVKVVICKGIVLMLILLCGLCCII